MYRDIYDKIELGEENKNYFPEFEVGKVIKNYSLKILKIHAQSLLRINSKFNI
jgi:hypothetical protein